MKRSEELRRKHRRILFWSIGGAIVAHVCGFVLWPEMHAEPLVGGDEEPGQQTSGDAAPLQVRVLFGHPEIVDSVGGRVEVDRQLRVEHLLPRSSACPRDAEVSLPAHGTVRLRVSQSGRTDALKLKGASGSECTDSVIVQVADALSYRWLPSERFPAPVELVQPVTLLDTTR